MICFQTSIGNIFQAINPILNAAFSEILPNLMNRIQRNGRMTH